MCRLRIFLLFFSILPFAFSQEISGSNPFPRPLILEFPGFKDTQLKEFADDVVQLKCTSWRVAGEANNLSPWLTIPTECATYLTNYLLGLGYELDLLKVSMEAGVYAANVNMTGDGKDAWIFDIDETLLSNLPYYADHGYGLEIFDSLKFDEWVETGMAPAIESSLKLYEEVLALGFKVFLLTGRSERHRDITVRNLLRAGFQEWDRLILRSPEDHGKTATLYKSEKRNELVAEGYRILGNSGDQWSDLLGSSMSIRSSKSLILCIIFLDLISLSNCVEFLRLIVENIERFRVKPRKYV